MLSKEQIRNLAVTNQTTEINIKREYLQHVFLTHFYRQENSNQVLFKGGTALRICFLSPRFSEDLDFSATISSVNKIEEMLTNTFLLMQNEGIATEILEAKQTSGGYLAIAKMLDDQIQIEISLRNKGATGEPMTISSNLVLPYTLVALKQEQLVAEKIEALLTRGRARDFYDIYFILRSRLLPKDLYHKLSVVLDAVKKTKISFDRELKIFLPRSHWATIGDFKNVLERELQRHI